MQSNLSVNSVQPNFQAKVSNKFIRDAHNLFNYKYIRKDLKVNFDEKAVEFENFGFDDYIIKYIKKDADGKRLHQLIAVRYDLKDSDGIILSSKDQFRKLIEKFTHMNKYEFSVKMKDALDKKFPIKTISE